MIYILIISIVCLAVVFSAGMRREILLFIFACKNAARGLRIAFSERNLRIESVCACIVILLGLIFHITLTEWLILTLVIGLVIGLETMNTAVEKLADKITKEKDGDIKKIKDIAAGAVFLASLCALVIGVLIFTPRILNVLF